MALSNFRIGIRPAAGFTLVVALMLGVCAVGWQNAARVLEDFEDIVSVEEKKVELLSEMLEGTEFVARAQRERVLSDASERVSIEGKLQQARSRYDAAWEQLQKLQAADGERTAFERVGSATQEARAADDRLLALLRSDDLSQANALLRGEAGERLAARQKAIEDALAVVRSHIAARFQVSRQASHTAQVLLTLCASEGTLPADVLTAVCERAGLLDQLEELREG